MIFVILFSLYFYYKSSAEYCFILLGVCLFDFVLGNILGHTDNVMARKIMVALNVVVNIGMLCYFKYLNLIVATFADGSVLTKTKCTTGAPAALKLTVEETAAQPDDYAIVTCSFLDADGREVPTASNSVSFCCRGDGIIHATGADPSDHSSPYLHYRKAFSGTITVAVKSTGNGPIYHTARSEGLLSAYTEL